MSKSETGLNSPLTSYCLVDQVDGIIITCAVLNCDYFIHVLALVSKDLQINTYLWTGSGVWLAGVVVKCGSWVLLQEA